MDVKVIMANLAAKHPGESEYLQAVQEVLESIEVPIIIAAAGMQTVGYIVDGGAVPINVPALLIGMFTAAITGYIAIKFMLKIIKKANYKWFSLYLIGVSIFTLISYFVKF